MEHIFSQMAVLPYPVMQVNVLTLNNFFDFSERFTDFGNVVMLLIFNISK